MAKRETATYDIVPAGERVLDDFRGDRIVGKVFKVVKTPEFGNPSEYEIVSSTIGEWCNCPGHENHGKCKHMRMFYDYLTKHQEESGE